MNLLKSLISVSFMTCISRILGFIRDVLIASVFGASIFTDAFFIAFKIPNLLRSIFSDGVFSQSFIPVLIEYKVRENQKNLKEFVSSVFGFTILIFLSLVILGMFFLRFLILINAPGFLELPEQLKLSENLLMIMLPYILFIALSAVFSSILNSWNYFSIASLSPIFLNCSIIFFSIFFSSYFHPPILSLAWAVVIGGFFQFLYHVPFLYKINILVMPKINWNNIGFLKILKTMGPTFLSSSVNQISLIINTIFISFLNAGSVSWMYYADRLIEFPIGVFGVALSTVLFTSFVKIYNTGSLSEYRKLLNWGFRLGCILSIPSSIALFFLAQPIIIVLFQYGKFTCFDVIMIQRILESYSFGLIPFILVKILSSAFYACEETSIPMKISFFTIFLIQMMNPFLIFYLQHAGIALSISIASWINFFLLYWNLYKTKIILATFNELFFIFITVISSLIMMAIIFLMLQFMPEWNYGSFFNRFTRLFCVILISGIGYLMSLYFFGIRLFNFSYKISSL